MIPRKKSDFKIVPKAKRLKNPIFRYLMEFKKNFEAINGEFNELDIRLILRVNKGLLIVFFVIQTVF
jgi:hypothetical protein